MKLILTGTAIILALLLTDMGCSRRWHQNARYSHYDICKSKREQAIRFGAKQINRREFVDLATAKMKGKK